MFTFSFILQTNTRFPQTSNAWNGCLKILCIHNCRNLFFLYSYND